MSKKKPVLRKLAVLAAMLAMALVGLVPALAQSVAADSGTVSANQSLKPPETNDDGIIRGTITNISGSVVLVEEDPSKPVQTTLPSPPSESGAKGYFTVTGETRILKQQEDKQVPAAFEDLRIGQLVEATYAGAIAESYPTQGNAGSIVILQELACMLPEGRDDPGEETVTAMFELIVECEPPSGTEFSASIGQGPTASGRSWTKTVTGRTPRACQSSGVRSKRSV